MTAQFVLPCPSKQSCEAGPTWRRSQTRLYLVMRFCQIRNVLIISHAGLVVFTKQFNDDIQQVCTARFLPACVLTGRGCACILCHGKCAYV